MKHLLRSFASWLRAFFNSRSRDGKKTDTSQFDVSPPGRRCDVVIGFDFGTSCTKIIVRTPYEHNRAFAVPFKDAAHPTSSYLLPSVLWVSHNGDVSLTSMPNSFCIRNVKSHLMQSKRDLVIDGLDGNLTLDSLSVAVVFLALALRHTRNWFLNAHKDGFGSFVLDWQFNLGLPSADFADKVLCQDYLRIAAAAWQMSVEDRRVELPRAKSTYEAVTVQEEESAGGVGGFFDCGERLSAEVKLIPEVAAEVVGYARSDLRAEGLHVLMDIGASTLDVCSFILHERDGDDRYELLTADVRELGAIVLHQNRVDVIRQSVSDQTLSKLAHWDPVAPIPDAIDKYLSPQLGPQLRTSLQDSDISFRKKCSQMITKTLFDLKTLRDPRSPRWSDEVPLFIAGGARGMALYIKSIDDASERFRELYPPCKGIQKLSLTKPENLEAEIDDDGYPRLAVAWGLSYPDTDIGMVTRPGDIKDISPRRRAKPKRPFVSKDMV